MRGTLKVVKKEFDAIQYTGDNLKEFIDFYCHFNNDVLGYWKLTAACFDVIDGVINIKNDKFTFEIVQLNDYVIFKKNQLNILSPAQFNKKYIVIN
jgi:hypothetical protein